MPMTEHKVCAAWELPVHKGIHTPCQGSFILLPERDGASCLVSIWIQFLLILCPLLMKEQWVEFCQFTPYKCSLEITGATWLCR